MNTDSLAQVFDRFGQLNILIIGDVMVDSYLWGKVNRISPEAPVPIVQVQKREKRLGGAANVAMNIAAMGATPYLCSVIGDDQEGNEFLNLLSAIDLSSEGIAISKSRQTTVKHRIISGSQQMLRVDAEDESSLNKEDHKLILHRINQLFSKIDIIIFEDYDKGVITPTLIKEVVEMATKANIPVVVDPKKKNFLAYKNVTLFKPNLKELREGLKIDIDHNDINAVEKAIDMLLEKINAKSAMITLSENGVYIKGESTNLHVPAHLRKIADVSGAGDTVIAVTALCVALNLPLSFTAKLANLAGGLVCESLGVVPVEKNRLLEEAFNYALNKDL